MNITVEQRENAITRIALEGRFDLQGNKEINQKLADAISTGTRHVVIDLSLVSLITSIGIHSLVAAAQAQAARGGQLALVRPKLTFVTVLEITGIDRIVPVYDDLEAACQGLLGAR